MVDISIMEDVMEDEVEKDDDAGVGFRFSISSAVRMVAVTSATFGIEVVIKD